MKHNEYFNLRYIEKLTDYARIDSYEGLAAGEARKLYNSIDEYYASKLGISLEGFKELQSKFKDYHAFYTKYYNSTREALFGDYKKFLNWHNSQKDRCGYCGVTQSELLEVVNIRGGNLTLNNKTKRSKGALEIEKRDPAKEYTNENSILCCPLCNNAKSNLISEDDWNEFFVSSMKAFYKSILGYDIGS